MREIKCMSLITALGEWPRKGAQKGAINFTTH